MSATAEFSPARRAFLRGKLRPEELARPAHEPRAAIAGHCLALHGVSCFSCRDACDEHAIVFRPALGGSQPLLLAAACTGCGECVDTCPVGAIAVRSAEAADGR